MQSTKRKEKFINRITEIESKLINLHNDMNEEIKDCINNHENNKFNKEYINLSDARDWVNLSLEKLQIAIRVLNNKKGY